MRTTYEHLYQIVVKTIKELSLKIPLEAPRVNLPWPKTQPIRRIIYAVYPQSDQHVDALGRLARLPYEHRMLVTRELILDFGQVFLLLKIPV